MNKIIKVAIIGYGVVGRRRRIFIDQHPNMHTVAVCDVRFRDDASMANGNIISKDYKDVELKSMQHPFSGIYEDGVYFYNNYQELLNQQNLDAVFVCVPNYLAPKVTMEGLKKGLHVFCEKPPGRTVEDIIEVRSVEQEFPHLKLKYGFNHRYHGSIMRAKQIIDDKEFGELVNFRGVYGKSSVVPSTGEWRSLKKYAGGGILLDQGIHMLDMFRYFCGDFDEVKSFVSNKHWGHEVEDNVYAILRDKQGRIAMIHSSATQWQHNFRLEITFQKGCIELSGILSGTKSYGQEKLIIVSRQEDSLVGSLSTKEILYLEDNSWNEEIKEFADLILNDKPVENGSSKDALDVMKLVYNIYHADPQWQEVCDFIVCDSNVI
ncbi:MAG: Gfo/Idh/MocA family oxidoreductase [Bacteroidales bacterium]|nr:Gfo/Idh/MocA family oxidoreductase [Bacteroidales bacterium]